MADSKFGAKLRQLRKKARMSQREVADKVKIDFTYLSKIESGVMPPPSEEKIRRLAKVLGCDEYELITLAGKVPIDLKRLIVRNKTVLRYLRSYKPDKAANEEKGKQ